MLEGTIIKGIGGFYYVDTGEEVLECKARGLFRKDDITPLPGDNVIVEISEPGFGTIKKLQKRRSQLVRPAVANVDQLLIVIACASPQPDLMLADKLLLVAQLKEIKPLVIINKSDLVSFQEIDCIQNQYAMFDCLVLSNKSGLGMDELKNTMKDCISTFAGQSGVGKSSLLNSILNSTAMETGNVSDKIKRGKHTTRHAELFRLTDGGFILDTPGFSSYELDSIPFREVWRYYPEMREIGDDCRFKGCIHVSEPGCIVKQAMSDGSLSQARYERYVQLVTELKHAYDNRYR